MSTALITGASTGLGAEYARQLAARHHDLVLVARDAEALHRVAADMDGVSVEVLPADLLDPADLAQVEERLQDRTKPVDLLINNAGFGMGLSFETNDVDDEVRHLRIHNEVPLRLTHAVLPGLIERRRGRILNLSSVAAFLPRSTYSACKIWLINFSRWANIEYADRGITVTAVCPGFTHTSFHERLGLPPGEEGISDWLWLDAERVVKESLADAQAGRSVSIPSKRYKAIVAVSRLIPDRLLARAARTGRRKDR
ncbi:SDR family NAD(P)-dependent oxidoreductase [Naumannella halotolerans]|uniref:SDR family NAD(P)-dependent oxidoreductase n=1 Tax=Naumannella halotolerans TaxID=993414 RepID=UPI00370D14C7